jgi:hypothetical protein
MGWDFPEQGVAGGRASLRSAVLVSGLHFAVSASLKRVNVLPRYFIVYRSVRCKSVVKFAFRAARRSSPVYVERGERLFQGG